MGTVIKPCDGCGKDTIGHIDHPNDRVLCAFCDPDDEYADD